MKPFKHSVSRKHFHRLSTRQRRRINSEIKNNFRLSLSQDSITPEQSNSVASYIHVANSSQIDNVPFTGNIANDTSNITDTSNINNDILSVNNYDSENSTSSLSNISFTEETFQDRLATCFVNNNLTHVQCNNILSLLRTHICFSSLPKDVRTLLKTPRTPVVITKIGSENYIHFSLEKEIVKTLSCLGIFAGQ